MGGEGLGFVWRGLSKGMVWAVDGAYAQDPKGWKRPWGLQGLSLRLNGTVGIQACPPPLILGGNLTWEPSRLLGPKWGGAIALRSSLAPPRGPLPPASPDLPGLRGADPVWPPLLLPLQYPHVLPVHLGVPPISLGVRVPHQWPAGDLVVGRR